MKLDVYEFGRELLRTNDLDPIYVMLWEANLPRHRLLRWLLAYWCFYHAGTASWISDVDEFNQGEESQYWGRMRTAAESKEYPRCHERRHFRGANAAKSIAYLESRGLDGLFPPLLRWPFSPVRLSYVMETVQEWVGFGPWIAFKVADMLERLDLLQVEFDAGDAIYKGSPTEGAQLLWELEGRPIAATFGPGVWAVDRILTELGGLPAPPRYERSINAQEAETILCKWKSYRGGHYDIGEDIESLRRGLLRFARCSTAQTLLRAMRNAKLGG